MPSSSNREWNVGIVGWLCVGVSSSRVGSTAVIVYCYYHRILERQEGVEDLQHTDKDRLIVEHKIGTTEGRQLSIGEVASTTDRITLKGKCEQVIYLISFAKYMRMNKMTGAYL